VRSLPPSWTFSFLHYLGEPDGDQGARAERSLALRVPLDADQASRLAREHPEARFLASLSFVHPDLGEREALFAEDWSGRRDDDGEGRAWLVFEARAVSGDFLLSLMALSRHRGRRRPRLVVSARIQAAEGGGEHPVRWVAADWDLGTLIGFCRTVREAGAEILVEGELPWRPAA